jgi:hypothetical protein
MHQAARRANVAPDPLSFVKTVRILRSALLEAQIVARAPFVQWYDQLLAEMGACRLPQRDKHRQAPQPTKAFADAVVILGAVPRLPQPAQAQPALI